MKFIQSIIKFCIGFNVNSHSVLNNKKFVNLERRNRARRDLAREDAGRRSPSEQASRESILLDKKAS